MSLEEVIAAGRGLIPADIVLRNAKVVDVISGDIFETDVAIFEGIIIGFGDYAGKDEIDLKGRYLAPGFIDGHIHIESSMLTPREFARAAVPRGTTSIVSDPHEIANVRGIEGLNYILRSSENIPLNLFITLPSCVPATPMETSGAILSSGDLALLMPDERILGLSEMMNFPGVLNRDHEVLNKIRLAKKHLVDGHAPGLSGKDLNAYVDAGIRSDHECTTADEAKEKLRAGMHIMARESSSAKNLPEILSLVTSRNSRQFMLVRDDLDPRDLLEEGHVDYLLKRAVELGVDPIIAVQMATINPAGYFGLKKLGAVAPGYRADLVVLEDLRRFKVSLTIKDGEIAAREGEAVTTEENNLKHMLRSSINFERESLSKLSIPALDDNIRVIGIVPDQIITEDRREKAKIYNGEVIADASRDILKIAVVERHQASGNVGVGFVQGFGLKKGAIASSVAHDSHNILIVGTNDDDMKAAALEIKSMRGGQVVIEGGKVKARLPLPIAGLISDQSIDTVVRQSSDVGDAARKLGCSLRKSFMLLSFLALPVIPQLKITDKGLVDVDKFKIVPLFL